jgi:sodium transport system permease protein
LQKHFFLPLPPTVVEQLHTMTDLDQPLWLVLVAFAVAPAICEELAFRGFILSGFARSNRVWLAIVLSSVMFGLMHMIPQQVYNAALLGLVLGLIAVKSGSLLPSVVFHGLWNSLAVLHGRWGQVTSPDAINQSPCHWLLHHEGGQIHYRWPLLLSMLALGTVLIWWLVKTPAATDKPRDPWDETGTTSEDSPPIETEVPRKTPVSAQLMK